MSLVDEIRANTSNVRLAKLALAQAIENKGSSVGNYANVPSFSNIIMGVNNIETGLKVNGTTDTKIFANSAINKGDVCALELPEVSGYSAISKGYSIPTKATYSVNTSGSNPTTGDITKIPPKVLADGKFLVAYIPYGQYTTYISCFYLVDGVYKQLTINNIYYLDCTLNGSPSGTSKKYIVHKNKFAFDDINNIFYCYDDYYLYAYKLDVTTLNLTKLASIRTATTYDAFDIYVHNNNVFLGISTYTVQYYYNVDSNTFTEVGYIYRNMSFTPAAGLKGAFDYTYDAFDNLYVYMYSLNGSTSTATIRKMSLDANGVYQPTGKDIHLTGVKVERVDYSNGITTLDNPALNLNFACTSAVYVDTNNTLHYIAIDTDTMTYTEVKVPFSDELDTTQISSIKLVKGKQFLYVKSSSSEYTSDEQVRLYHYNMSEGYEFVGCPVKFFNPATMEGVLPNSVPAELKSDLVPMVPSTGHLDIYEVKVNEMQYEYTGQPCNNMLAGAAAYGVATQDIAANEIGTGVLLLS